MARSFLLLSAALVYLSTLKWGQATPSTDSRELLVGGAGACTSFNGQNHFMVLAQGLPCPPFTVEFWVQSMRPEPRVLLSHYSRLDSRALFSIDVEGNVVADRWMRGNNDSGPTAQHSPQPPFHWALVADTGAWSVYINGTQRHEIEPPLDSVNQCSSPTPTAYPWVLGCAVESRGSKLQPREHSCFHGLLDNLRLWREARTSSQIQGQMYINPGDHEDALLQRWTFDAYDGWTALLHGFDSGDGSMVSRPHRGLSPMPLWGGPVPHMPGRIGETAECSVCAAVSPAVTRARGTAHLQLDGTSGTLLTAEGVEVLSLDVDLEVRSLQPFAEAMDATFICGSVLLKSWQVTRWHVPFTVDVEFSVFDRNTSMAANGSILIMQPDLLSYLEGEDETRQELVVGRARAVQLAKTTLELGTFDVPLPAAGSSFAFSVWVYFNMVSAITTTLVQGPVELEMNASHLTLYNAKWPTGLDSGANTEVIQKFRGLLVINVRCTGSQSTAQLFVDGRDLGEKKMRTLGCWHSAAPWRLGDPNACNTQGDEYDDFRLWKRALTLAEVQGLHEGRPAALDDVIARLTFDNIYPRQDCLELQKLGVDTVGDTWCPAETTTFKSEHVNSAFLAWLMDRGCSRSPNFTLSPHLREVLVRTMSVPSRFPKVPGSTMHRILREGTQHSIRLNADHPGALTFALHQNSSISGVELVEALLSYSAPDLEGQDRMTGKTVRVGFSGCDGQGRCEPGLAMFHVQPRGPRITRFQMLPTSNMMRLFFSQPTNTPIIRLARVLELFEFSGLPPEMPRPTAVEWATNQLLRFHYPAASMWRLLPDVQNSSRDGLFSNISLRVKTDFPELWIRDPLELKYPCDDTALPELLVCREGTSPENGAPGCVGCKVGERWTRREGCLPCEPGRYQSDTGQVDCNRCQVGRYATEWGTTSCELCESVLPGSTTAFQGMRGNESCVCPAGHTWTMDTPTSRPRCRLCREGLLCPGGRRQLNETESNAGFHRVALQAAGYSAGLPAWAGGEPTFLVRCSSNIRCPSGLELGTCPPLALGRACTQCEPGSFLHKDRCRLCEEANDTLPLVFPLVMLVLALLCLYWFSTRPPALFDEKTATVTTSSSVLFSAMQVVGALANLEVPWPEPMPTLKSWLDVVMLQVDNQGFQCFVNVGNSSNSYLGQLALYPAVAITLMLVLLLKRGLLRQQLDMPQVINMQGLALMSLFTSIAALSVTPLKCRTDNPDGSSTLEAHRSVVCWDSEKHRGMLSGSIVACLVFVVGFISVVAWATLVYPSKVVAPDGGAHLARFRFLFWPYTPKRYYFGLLFGLRKLMVALAPLLVVNWGQGQLLLMMFVICGNMGLQCALWPWRTSKTNTLDGLLAVMLMALMATGFMLGGFHVVSDGTSAQNMVISALTAGFGLFLWTLAGYIMKASMAPSRTYRIFLSHHKVGAGLLARWIKMLLQEDGVHPERVFLDSDNLLHLDRLMHTVAHDTENVVVLLTGETLSRPWCAMEIVAACRAGVKVIPVICDSYRQITDKFLDSLPTLWTVEQQTTMVSGGVDTQDVRLAYMLLRAEEPLALVRKGADVETHVKLVHDVLDRCARPSKHRWLDESMRKMSTALLARTNAASALWVKSEASLQHVQSVDSERAAKLGARVAILCDLELDEPACACRVLQNLLQEGLQESVVVCPELREEFRHVLVLMGPEILKNLSLARLLVQAAEQPGVQDLVPLLVGDYFEFPGPTFWSDLRVGRVFSFKDLEQLALTPARVEAAYRRLLNTLAMRFSGHASRAMQAAEVAFMVGRIKACLTSSPPPRCKELPQTLDKHVVTASV